MAQIDIFDFKHIKKAPEATEKQPISKVIKVFFDEWTFDDPYEAIAIDIENNEIYVNPIISARGLRAQDGIVQISNTEKIIDILNKHNVQEWKRNYTFEDPETYQDGYSWSLLLQFEDGTVEKHWGDGTNKKKLTPDNFDDFAKELNEFVKERLEDN
ncbi:hypothetical protein SAMN05421736_11612 [Evansella caseinilytica]|uniref:Uncharacterized protein n=1 Tax=Evansella caseinilytica TaxID=1503961 RepID=A0A1H3TSN9_9BACI|nr:hypothetical protein SAMN05421736_11612 [Evansella caseinilytica]